MVSVIIPYHNNRRTIMDTLDSVARQTYRDVEVIIVDDMSLPSQRVEDIVEDYDSFPFPIMVINSKKNLGASGARNLGVRNARGKYIAYLDSDDVWKEDKLDKQIKIMEKFTYMDKYPKICFTGRRLISLSGKSYNKIIGCDMIVNYDKLLLSNQINCSSVLIRRVDALKYPFPDGNLHEDYAVWLKLLEDGGYGVGINKPLLDYRISMGSRSSNKFKSALMTYRVYRYIGLSFFKSLKYMRSYIVKGIEKYA
ncbi:MAG: glycosyltransferase family 2 protein [Eubacterium sp.]|nr:glycosyltransferase family 2 protein [Eubacterium sp.]